MKGTKMRKAKLTALSLIVAGLVLGISTSIDQNIENAEVADAYTAFMEEEIKNSNPAWYNYLKEYIDSHPEQLNINNLPQTYMSYETYTRLQTAPVYWWYLFETAPEHYDILFKAKAVYSDGVLVLAVYPAIQHLDLEPILLYSSRIAASGIQPGQIVDVYYGTSAAYMECRKKAGLKYIDDAPSYYNNWDLSYSENWN